MIKKYPDLYSRDALPNILIESEEFQVEYKKFLESTQEKAGLGLSIFADRLKKGKNTAFVEEVKELPQEIWRHISSYSHIESHKLSNYVEKLIGESENTSVRDNNR